MVDLIVISTVPICIYSFYMFIRDKYEKEPIYLLLVGLTLGILSGYPIILIEIKLVELVFFKNIILGNIIFENLYNSFVVAGLTEELIKFIILYIVFRWNKNFNEKFDGIVYAVFIGLGFALIENILYVTNPRLGGIEVGFLRAIISVPAHMFYSIVMGYYVGLLKFNKKDIIFLIKSITMPVFFHGAFDFILTIDSKIWYLLFFPYFIFLILICEKKIKDHLENSPFK